MKTKTLWAVVAVCAAAVSAGGLAQAQEKGGQGEGTPGPAYKASGTKESRSAERKANRAKQADAEKKGDVTPMGDATPNPAYKASGTKESRSAERKANRAKQADAEKKGDVVPAGEAPAKK